MHRSLLVLLASGALAACATVPMGPQPFDTSDPIPDELKPVEVTQASLVQLLRDGVPGIQDYDADRIAADAVSRRENTITSFHNPRLRYDLLVESKNHTHYAILLKTSAEGFPILPVERIATAINIEGITAQAQYALSQQIAQCLASNGRCTVLALFDNGNGFVTTIAILKDNPIHLTTDGQFLKAGTFAVADYMVVSKGGSGVTTNGHGNAKHKQLPILVPPRPSPPSFSAPNGGVL